MSNKKIRVAACFLLTVLLACACVGFGISFSARAEEQASPFGRPAITVGEFDGNTVTADYDDVIVYLSAEEGELKATYGGKTLGSLEAYSFTDTVPVYYPADEAAADLLVAMLAADKAAYAMIASSDPALMKSMRSKLPEVRGAIDFRSSQVADWRTMRDTVNENMGSVAIAGEDTDKETIRNLRKLGVMVWLACSGGKKSSMEALTKAPDGVLTDNPGVFSAVLSSYSGVIAAPPMIICHRGNTGIMRDDGTLCPENSVEGAVTAYEAGADGVEVDVYLTADEVPIIMHNDTINATTTGTGSITAYDLEYYKRYKLKTDSTKYEYEIPTLEDYFKRFKGTDLLFFVELKAHQEKLVEKVVELIKEYEMEYNVVFISFTEEHLKKARALLPCCSVTFLSMEATGVSRAREKCGALNAGTAPTYTMITDETVSALVSLGIGSYVWTFGDTISFKNAFIAGAYRSMTTDTLCDQVKSFEVDEFILSADANKPTSVRGTARCYDGSERSNVKIELLQIGGSLEILQSGDGYYASGEGSATVVPIYRETGLKGFALLGEPITVEAGQSAGAGDGKAGCGCGGVAGAASVLVSSVCLAAACGIIILRKKKA